MADELTEEQMIPASLLDTSSVTRLLCFLALGRPDLEDHWESLQSKEGFEDVRKRLCSILSDTISVVSYSTLRVQAAADIVEISPGEPDSRDKLCFRVHRFSCAIL
jgi:hypothetical protein